MLALDIRKEHRLANQVFVPMLLALAAAPLVANILATRNSGSPVFQFPACAVLRRTGRPCPACGLTRSVLAFYKGDFAASRTWHPAGSLLVSLIFIQLLFRTLYLAEKSEWIPWIDIGQALLTGLLFRSRL